MHLIEKNSDNKYCIAYVGETPWHGLGTQVPADLSPKQMLKAAGVDWTVNKVPAFANIEGKQVGVGWSALVRSNDNKILDIVSNDWNPVQNDEAFDFFREYCEIGDMEMHTAGSLKDGQIVWCLAKIKESFDLFKGDQVDNFLLFTNPHRFGQGIDVRMTPIRVVCNNTISVALSHSSKMMFKASHRNKFDAQRIKEQMGIATDKLSRYKEMAAFLGSKRYTEETLKQYFSEVFPSMTLKEKEEGSVKMSRAASMALDIIETQPGAEFARGSWWQGFNATTFLIDHVLGRSTDSRLTSAWYGPNRNLKVKALERAVEFAEAA